MGTTTKRAINLRLTPFEAHAVFQVVVKYLGEGRVEGSVGTALEGVGERLHDTLDERGLPTFGQWLTPEGEREHG